MKTFLATSELERIIAKSGLSLYSRDPHKPTATRIVEYDGRRYKVRVYPDEQSAQQQLEIISQAHHLFTRCYGRVSCYLVLEYIEGDSLPHRSKQHLPELGTFLAELSAVEIASYRESDFESWCEVLRAKRIFLPSTIKSIKDYCVKVRKTMGVHWGLEYFDAMPRNFVLQDDELISIDEKHLHIGPKGIGLIKPMWELLAVEFEQVLATYRAKTNYSPFEDPEYRRFLLLYYIIFGLAFVVVNKPKQQNIRIPEFHRRRRQLLKLIDSSPVLRVREETLWVLQYYLHHSWMLLKRTGNSLRYRFANVSRSYPV